MEHDLASGGARRRRDAGFTLIEIMAAVLIIGLLTSIVGVVVIDRVNQARVQTTRTQLKQLESAIAFYQMDTGRFPTTEQGLDALVNPPAGSGATGSYLQGGALPRDAWQNPFQYTYPGPVNVSGYDLWSLGADGSPGGEGNNADIGNWSESQEG